MYLCLVVPHDGLDVATSTTYMSKILSHNTKVSSRALKHLNMPAFTLYGAHGSTNTDRVRLTLAEGGFTDYEVILLDLFKGEQKVS